MRRRASFGVASAVAVLIVAFGGSAAGQTTEGDGAGKSPARSGLADFGPVFGTGLSECPQAGEPFDKQPKPLDRRTRDKVEQISNGGDDVRVNQDYACLPQNETSIDVSPANQRNMVAGVNDYMNATAGFMASTDNGNHWYHNTLPVVDEPERDILESGDPAVAFDRQGVAYFATIAFSRTDDKNGIFVHRSTNGGFTWSKPCVPQPLSTNPIMNPTDRSQGCGPVGRGAFVDPRTPGDGIVAYEDDPDQTVNGSVPFHDKEWITAGPRPAGVEPQCFTSAHAPEASCPEGAVGVDRVYVTWTMFTAVTGEIMFSYSDDRGRSWSPRRVISGSAPFCSFGVASNCDSNQFSVPTTNPTTGHLYIAFENFNTEDENQYLLVRSRDGGQTFEGPFFITPVFDVNYPRANTDRPDCRPRGQQTNRAVLDNTCHRVNSGGNVVVDKRGGQFADDLYMVFSDNRNGTRRASNADVFMFASKDGGTTWIGPTRVNDDPSGQPANRACSPTSETAPCPATNFGADQWFPWVDISERGDLNVVFYDRRLDRDSIAHEWPTSRTTPGDYLTWFWGGVCSVTTTETVTTGTTAIPAAAHECLAPTATIVTPPTGLQNPGPELFPNQTVFPFKNFTISDVPSNMDYSFGAGVFIGDYNNVAIGPDNQAVGFWTDARNGRSSRLSSNNNPAPSPEPGRNPICEQSDAFADLWSAQSGGSADKPKASDAYFLVTPCPVEADDPSTGN